MSVRFINVDNPKKLVVSACYVKQHVCAYLRPFSRYASQHRTNNHFLEGYPSLTPACAGLLKPRWFELGLLKFPFSIENFVRRLFWSIARHTTIISSKKLLRLLFCVIYHYEVMSTVI